MRNIYKETIAIPLVEYEELLRESEKVECVKRYCAECIEDEDDETVLDTILTILDTKEAL